MRQAVNNLQSTYSGFNFVGAEEVFKVCDQPHPVKVQALIKNCIRGDIDEAMTQLEDLWRQGYAAVDIVTTLFRVVKGMEGMAEYMKLQFIKVSSNTFVCFQLPLLFVYSPRCFFAITMTTMIGNWIHSYENSRRSQYSRAIRWIVGSFM
jgi:hypothetical protein